MAKSDPGPSPRSIDGASMPAAASDASPKRACPTSCTVKPRSAAAVAQARPMRPAPITSTSGAERDESLVTCRNYPPVWRRVGRPAMRIVVASTLAHESPFRHIYYQAPTDVDCGANRLRLPETAGSGAAYREQSSFGDPTNAAHHFHDRALRTSGPVRAQVLLRHPSRHSRTHCLAVLRRGEDRHCRWRDLPRDSNLQSGYRASSAREVVGERRLLDPDLSLTR